MKIGILGVTGRMGRAIGNAAAEAGVTVAGGIDREGAVHGDYADAASLAAASDVLIDFSAVAAFDEHLKIAVEAGKPILIGTTGLQPEHHATIDEAAKAIAVLQSANTSLGINLLRGLIEQAAARLGPDWDIEVLEMHHRHKVDAPSGTALLLAQSAAKGRGSTLQELSRFDRISEHPHAREEGTIGYASLRGGSVAGDHMLIFAGEGERIEFGHRADSRAIFARGAIRGAEWLKDQPAGRYTMVDVLGL
ncbi:4-hydroxy-tetrahydrodipicolinate reductase [Sphingomonas tabacisoli]|uniref:4-hydroxy-tetrahydrodipicolinate reductase n=1 Tax=Sphingomonas tabacisoli TaxID=2249466 RepID=A0ABW4I395_9SPHN